MPNSNTGRVAELIEAIVKRFSGLHADHTAARAEIQRVLELLKTIPAPTGRFVRSQHPIIQYADSALAGGNVATSFLLDAIRPAIRILPWRYSYARREDAPDLGERIAFAELIGPEAPFISRSVCLGLTLIAPRTLYPAHKHPAVELYYVVSGAAEWTAGAHSQIKPPGTYILHQSNCIHAMRTGNEPLLAVYTWTGADVVTTSVYAAREGTSAQTHL